MTKKECQRSNSEFDVALPSPFVKSANHQGVAFAGDATSVIEIRATTSAIARIDKGDLRRYLIEKSVLNIEIFFLNAEFRINCLP